MKKDIIKQRQAQVRLMERDLENETQRLLVDVLLEMTQEEKDSLAGYRFDEYKEIVKIDEHGFSWRFTDDDEEDEPYDTQLHGLTQREQKELIDYVIVNFWTIYKTI